MSGDGLRARWNRHVYPKTNWSRRTTATTLTTTTTTAAAMTRSIIRTITTRTNNSSRQYSHTAQGGAALAWCGTVSSQEFRWLGGRSQCQKPRMPMQCGSGHNHGIIDLDLKNLAGWKCQKTSFAWSMRSGLCADSSRGVGARRAQGLAVFCVAFIASYCFLESEPTNLKNVEAWKKYKSKI